MYPQNGYFISKRQKQLTKISRISNKKCLSALYHASVTCGFCCVWKYCMFIGSAAVCLEILNCHWFCCMWYLLYLEILHSHWVSTLLFQRMAPFLLSLHSDWLGGLEKEASIFQMASNSLIIFK